MINHSMSQIGLGSSIVPSTEHYACERALSKGFTSYNLDTFMHPHGSFVEAIKATLVYHGGPVELNYDRAISILDAIANISERQKLLIAIVTSKFKEASYPESIILAIDLIDMCVCNHGLDFAKYLGNSFFTYMSKLLKLTTFKKSFTRSITIHISKFVIGNTTNPGVATDPRLHEMKKKILSIFQLWYEAFIADQAAVPAFFRVYNDLRVQGIEFPAAGERKKYYIEDTQDSPAFNTVEKNKNAATVITESPIFQLIFQLRKSMYLLTLATQDADMEKIKNFIKKNIENYSNIIQTFSDAQDDKLIVIVSTAFTIDIRQRFSSLNEEIVSPTCMKSENILSELFSLSDSLHNIINNQARRANNEIDLDTVQEDPGDCITGESSVLSINGAEKIVNSTGNKVASSNDTLYVPLAPPPRASNSLIS